MKTPSARPQTIPLDLKVLQPGSELVFPLEELRLFGMEPLELFMKHRHLVVDVL